MRFMSLRLIELILSPVDAPFELKNIINLEDIIEYWEEEIPGQKRKLSFLVSTEKSSVILDQLEKTFSGTTEFRILLYPIEATLPRLKDNSENQDSRASQSQPKRTISSLLPVSREELYNDIEKTITQRWIFHLLIIISAIVASIGILKNNEVIIIGAMVIAPLLGPNVALSFATTLGDLNLGKKAIKLLLISIFLVLGVTIIIGFFFPVHPEFQTLVNRTKVDVSDVILALAAGSAATLSVTSELYSALIGVMVAVALLPPLVSLGLLLGAGFFPMARSAFLLFLTNLIGINLSGVVTFLAQGVRPLTWWEEAKAKKSTNLALIIWILLLIMLLGIICFG